jgi:hypothetical protein
MPISTPNLTAAVTAGLLSGGMIGMATPKLALGIGGGLARWIPLLVVQTTDAGSLGVGTGAIPFAVPAPLLISNLIIAYAANGQIGPSAPLEATGLGNGLATGFAQGLMKTNHPGVGTGTALARVIGPPAFSSLMQGFAAAGITGQGATLKANAISTALLVCLQAFQVPIPIVGSASPAAGGGVGIGKIL